MPTSFQAHEAAAPLLACHAFGMLLVLASAQVVPMTADEAVRVALRQSPVLRAARMQADAAQAQTDRERPVARPDVTARAEGRVQGPRVLFPRAGDGLATVLPEEYGRVDLTIDQPLLRSSLGAARDRYAAQTRANRWEVRRAENDLIRDTRRAYYNAQSARAQAEVAGQGVDAANAHLNQVKLMLEAGNAAERDVKAADADLAEAEQNAAKAESGAALALASLNRTVGTDPSAPITLSAGPATPPAVPVLAAGIAQALRRRPELRQLEEGITSARAGASLAGAQDKPALSGQAIAAVQTPTAFTKKDYFAAGLVLTWKPFDSARTRLDVREAKASAARAEALLEDAKLGIRLEVEKAWRDMGEAEARMRTADRQIAAAQAAADVSRLRFQARSATELEVSSALFAVSRARSNRAQALFDLVLAHADWLHATGADVPEGAP